MDRLNIFVPLTKVDAVKGIVYGTMAAEEEDRAKEIFDYDGSKPYFKAWSEAASKATNGKSLGNVRAMHGSVAAGKLTDVGFNDPGKRIDVAAKVVDKNELEKCLEGVYTGFSIAGRYVKRWADGEATRYIADPVECSLVDLPCIRSATFEVIKADGATMQKKFNPVGEIEAKARELQKAADPTGDWRDYEGDAIDALAKVANEPVAEPTNDEVADEARKMAKAVGDESNWMALVESAREALKAAKKKPKTDAKPGDKKPADAKGKEGEAEDDAGDEAEKGKYPDEIQVWTTPRLPGQTFTKKTELRAALTELDASEAAKKGAAPALDALKAVTDALDAKDGGQTKVPLGEIVTGGKYDEAIAKAYAITATDPVIKLADYCSAEQLVELNKTVVVVAKDGAIDFSAVKSALAPIIKAAVEKKEFSADERKKLAGEGKAMKDGSYPIASKADLKNAVQAYGRAKNKAAAKRHIIRRAKALGATSMLPEDWNVKSAQPVDMTKFATDELKVDLKKAATLYGVACLVQLLAQIDSAEEGLESPDYGYGTAVPKDLSDRFGTLLVEFGDIVAEVLDECLQAIREEEGEEAADMVARCDAAIELSKAVTDFPLVKVGARHSKLDQTRLNDAHDLLVDAGAQCDAIGDDEGAEKGTAADLRKQLTARDKAFAKTMDGVVDTIKDIADRVKRIEAQPLPEGTTHYRAVEKGGDVVIQFNGDKSMPAHLRTIEVASDMARLAAFTHR